MRDDLPLQYMVCYLDADVAAAAGVAVSDHCNISFLCVFSLVTTLSFDCTTTKNFVNVHDC